MWLTIFELPGSFIDDHLMAAVQLYQGRHAADTSTVLTNWFVLEHGFLHTAIRIILAESDSAMPDLHQTSDESDIQWHDRHTGCGSVS